MGGACGPVGGGGPVGTTGTCGVQGPQGADGDEGACGVLGYCGVRGTTGHCGIKGSSGACGLGYQGVTGTCGIKGTTGQQGSCGIKGTSGSSGTCGIKGTTGQQGSCGIKGTTGTCGIKGTSGTTGTCGIAGTCGLKGRSAGAAASFDYSEALKGSCGITPTLGAGEFCTNQTYAASVTKLFIQPDYSAPVEWITHWLLSLDDADGGDLIIDERDQGTIEDPSRGQYEVTSVSQDVGTGLVTVDLAYKFVGTSFSFGSGNDGDNYEFYFTPKGTPGTCGIHGASGACGYQGYDGACGLQGPSGTCGIQGPSGSCGTDGTCGIQGTSGTCGIQGTSGTCGPTGLAGSCGPQGIHGGSYVEITVSDSTSMADPGSGYFRLAGHYQNGQVGSDEMVIDDLDINGDDIQGWISRLVHSSSAVKSTLRITKRDDTTK